MFWLTDNLTLPAEIAAYVLWRHRRTGTVWRAGDPGKDDASVPITCWTDEDATKPAVAYLMPYAARVYPRWSEPYHDAIGDRRS